MIAFPFIRHYLIDPDPDINSQDLSYTAGAFKAEMHPCDQKRLRNCLSLPEVLGDAGEREHDLRKWYDDALQVFQRDQVSLSFG
jgi:hypothetical protein